MKKEHNNIIEVAELAKRFGRTNAQRIGLLPSKIDHQKITYVGNTSLSGAKWALLSTNVRKKVEEIAEKTSHIQLSLDSQFQTEFVDAMIFP